MKKAARKINRKGMKIRSLNTGIWLVLLGVFILLCGLFAFATIIVVNREERNYQISESETIIRNMSGSIAADVENYKEVSRFIMVEDRVVDFLTLPSESVDVGNVNDAKTGINEILNVSTSVDSVYVVRNDGKIASTARGDYLVDTRLYYSDAWMAPIINARGGAVVYINGKGSVIKVDSRPMLTIIREIYDIYSQTKTGILLLNISDSALDSIIQGQPNATVCIVTTDGEYLAGDEELSTHFSGEMLNSGISHVEIKEKNSKYLVSAKKVEGLPVVVMCSATNMKSTSPSYVLAILGFLLIAFLVSVLITGIFISKNVARPIESLTAAMEKTKESGWLEKIEVKMPNNEIGILSESYNDMIDNLNVMFTSLLEKEKDIREAEMRVLHEQIKPHFLYNSLETIGALAVEANAEEVHNAIETLGSFYRNFLSKGERDISLRRELKIIQDYLMLQKLRYAEIFHDEYDIAEDTLDFIIPKLILQPLVENSINHGIRYKGEEGLIKITSFLVGEELHLIVMDTGVGMTEEQIADALSTEKRDKQYGKAELPSSFGLWGTIERIRCYCGRDDVAKIESVEGEYTKIELIIPHI